MTDEERIKHLNSCIPMWLSIKCGWQERKIGRKEGFIVGWISAFIVAWAIK
jgi:hypothetical protein